MGYGSRRQEVLQQVLKFPEPRFLRLAFLSPLVPPGDQGNVLPPKSRRRSRGARAGVCLRRGRQFALQARGEKTRRSLAESPYSVSSGPVVDSVRFVPVLEQTT